MGVAALLWCAVLCQEETLVALLADRPERDVVLEAPPPVEPFWIPPLPVIDSRRTAPLRSDYDEPSQVELGLLRREELDAEPRLFYDVTGAALLPLTFTTESLAWLLMPGSVTVNGHRLFDQTGHEDMGSIFARTLVERETKFYAGLPNTYVTNMNVELGLEEMSAKRFNRLHSRVLFDSLKRSYRERYQVPALDVDTVTDTLSSGDWLDYIVVPSLVGASAARYGFDRKVDVDPNLRLTLHVEKGTRLYKAYTRHHGGQLGSLAITPFRLPVSLMVQTDMIDGRPGLGFIGIGTDLSLVMEALYGARPGD